MEVPARSLQFVSVGEEITIVSLVCEDLAETDQLADVIRSVGPTVVFTVLLDGPQLASRWAAGMRACSPTTQGRWYSR